MTNPLPRLAVKLAVAILKRWDQLSLDPLLDYDFENSEMPSWRKPVPFRAEPMVKYQSGSQGFN